MSYTNEIFTSLHNVIVSDKKLGVSARYDEWIDKITDLFLSIRDRKGNVFFVGNGGSAAIAIHMTADFLKNGRIRTISLYDPAVLTCLSNDYGYEEVFSKQLDILMNKDDLLVAISSSGNSQNIINAIEISKKIGAKTVGITGFKSNNKVNEICDILIHVPSEEYGIVESIHNLILQQIVDNILVRDNA